MNSDVSACGNAGDDALSSPLEIRAQLDRILADPGFQASSVRRELLTFIVEQTLAGRADRLKGLSLAVEVFGRGQDFDSQTDPVVRVEARRLRRDLHSYYGTEGAHDPIVISIPKGGYVPHFKWRKPLTGPAEQPVANRSSRGFPVRMALLAASVLLLVAVFGTIRLTMTEPLGGSNGHRSPTELPAGPRIAIAPLLDLSDNRDHNYLAAGLTAQIVTNLARFQALSVVPVQENPSLPAGALNVRELREKYEIDFLLTGSVRQDSEKVRLSSQLIDAQTGGVIWSESYSKNFGVTGLIEIEEDIAEQISAVLGSHYGVIAEEGLSEGRREGPATQTAYDCLLRYYAYQRTFDRSEHARVRDCLERTVALEPSYANAWAVLANIYAQEHRFGLNPRPHLYNSKQKSLAAAERAVDLEPRNPTAQLMLANALFDQDDFVRFKQTGARAAALNPNDPETLIHFGLRLVFMGEWDRGLPLANKAIALNPEHPEWYHYPAVFYHYHLGEYGRALEVLRTQKLSEPWGFLLQAMTFGQLGHKKEAEQAVERVLELRPKVREEFWDMARVWNISETHIAHMTEGLRKAGLEIPSLPEQI